MNLNYVPYDLSKWKKKICSTCLLFTDIDTSFIPIGRLVKSGGIEAVIDFYKSLGDSYYQELLDMLVFDAIILNEDRHFGNFGLLIDNKTNTIIKCAPIFDNGLSLLCYALDDELNDICLASSRRPATYNDFIEFIKPLMTTRQKEKVRKILDFQFNKNSRYKLPNKRLKKLEIIIQNQAKKLL